MGIKGACAFGPQGGDLAPRRFPGKEKIVEPNGEKAGTHGGNVGTQGENLGTQDDMHDSGFHLFLLIEAIEENYF